MKPKTNVNNVEQKGVCERQKQRWKEKERERNGRKQCECVCRREYACDRRKETSYNNNKQMNDTRQLNWFMYVNKRERTRNCMEIG